jgi:GTP-binding protein EngB required for normal cell division
VVRHNGADARRERLQEIARLIQRVLHTKEELSLSGMLIQIQYNFGLTEAKAMEYLRLLEKLGHFVLVEKEDKIKNAVEGTSESEDQ